MIASMKFLNAQQVKQFFSMIRTDNTILGWASAKGD